MNKLERLINLAKSISLDLKVLPQGRVNTKEIFVVYLKGEKLYFGKAKVVNAYLTALLQIKLNKTLFQDIL